MFVYFTFDIECHYTLYFSHLCSIMIASFLSTSKLVMQDNTLILSNSNNRQGPNLNASQAFS